MNLKCPSCKRFTPNPGYEHPCQHCGRAIRPANVPAPVLNPQIICPHCQQKGQVKTTPIQVKAGVSGAKATGVLLTGGLSVLATGLSRKEAVTQAVCGNCSMSWQIR